MEKERKMKKVLFFHHSGTIGGAGLSALNVVNSLSKKDYDITVFCTSSDSQSMSDLFQEHGYKVISGANSPKILNHFSGSSHQIFSPFFLKSVINILFDVSKIRKIIAEVNPDIVVMNSMTTFWIARVAKEFKKETILFFRETYVRGLFAVRTRIIKRLLSEYVDKIAFISEYENNLTDGLKSYRTTIYNALDGKKYDEIDRDLCRKELGLVDEQFYILYLGGMTAYKGAAVIVKAMKYLQEYNIKLIFVGYKWTGKKITVKDKKGILRKIKFLLGLNYEANTINEMLRLNLQDNIQFVPNQKEIAPYFKVCDCLVQPMTKAHQARPVFEAGYAKTPVVITDFPQIRELCDESNSYLFNNEDSKMLATRILEIYKHPKQAKLKAEINYQNTIERHKLSDYQKKISDLFGLNTN